MNNPNFDALISQSAALFLGAPQKQEEARPAYSGPETDQADLPFLGLTNDHHIQLQNIQENPLPFFSPFVLEHLEDMHKISEVFGEVADNAMLASPGTQEESEFQSLTKVVNLMNDLGKTSINPTLLERAKMHFFTHHPVGKKLSGSIPPLLNRHAFGLLNSDDTRPYAGHSIDDDGNPDGMEWYREDPYLNEHHEHWHIVWDMNTKKGPKVRRGELFIYMHKQMLARYNDARRAVGQKEVVPFDLRSKVKRGYVVGGYDFLRKYLDRSTNESIETTDVTVKIWDNRRFQFGLDNLKRFTHEFFQAIENGSLHDKSGKSIHITPENLGSTIEANADGIDGTLAIKYNRKDFINYGNLHNLGHIASGFVGLKQEGNKVYTGIMADTVTAIRDSFFFQWHKHIDNIGHAYQESLDPHDFSEDRPEVKIRSKGNDYHGYASQDIYFMYEKDLPNDDSIEKLLGKNWDKDLSGDQRFRKSLESYFVTRKYKARQEAEPGHFIYKEMDATFLAHQPYAYFLRVENKNGKKREVTCRVFLVPVNYNNGTGHEKYMEDRRSWIEMDKFVVEMNPYERKVVKRLGAESSVIRKSNDGRARAHWLGEVPPKMSPSDSNNTFCSCGWAYNQLLPRGTENGATYRWLVMFTDHDKDRVENDKCCGSFSYCGSKDNYPDRRTMGYPFDRPFKQDTEHFIRSGQNKQIAATDMTIKFTGNKIEQKLEFELNNPVALFQPIA